MILPLRIGYEGAALLARAVASVAPASGGKVLRSFAARRGVRTRYASFARQQDRPLLWMHAPSVGEGLQARPVLELARVRLPRAQLAYTYFSPSAERFAQSLDVDFRDVLPFDATGDARAALTALAPTALVFSKLDVWPTIAREAAARGVRLGLISATLARGSSRVRGLATALLRDAYARLDRVGAISEEDAERLVALGVPAERISVTGDTRYDQVWARAEAAKLDAPLLAPLRSERPTLVAGSTWPADERHLLEAWRRIQEGHREMRVIVAPHEPTATHLGPIERWCELSGLTCARLGGANAAEADVVLVDRVGVLGDLYALADLAFVGGGFHAAGLHSVLEPAAFGVPVVFGPRHANSRDAGLLLEARAAATASDTTSLEAVLTAWLEDDPARRAAGDAARGVVRAGLGAAERSFELVASLMR
ncbi:MAG TPA: glycosyltransferase N-terminal domain-containing protein [Gemmatimonadaceae bacterium]|nr:glycosyltransferase N-terminal domain-containing protein [Gemmatimonadaceae bacterium]